MDESICHFIFLPFTICNGILIVMNAIAIHFVHFKIPTQLISSSKSVGTQLFSLLKYDAHIISKVNLFIFDWSLVKNALVPKEYFWELLK